MTVVYFDMDGVLCDWVDGYNSVTGLPELSKFSKLPKEEKNRLKSTFVNYDFFYNLKPIQKGLDLLKQKFDEGYDVRILSAVGDINIHEVEQAKRNWIKRHIGDIECTFVRKVHQKASIVTEDNPIFIDDRQDAIDAWQEAGFVGILFTQ